MTLDELFGYGWLCAHGGGSVEEIGAAWHVAELGNDDSRRTARAAVVFWVGCPGVEDVFAGMDGQAADSL
ncbi:hypothetical protein U9M48_041260 [Paspalum notatum var. saurae]|uniref:Uncharacterized protein n=1 Tax=Paspalum notatum var. saurae TaxID=547442 RepID=A0AAQ3UNU4_PASNO